MPAWNDYQEEVASFFRSLGLEADTNVKLAGTRTSHDVDVVVRSKHVGLDVVWLVECKAWSRPISKEKVLALRTIVNDIGADRGLMMSESGYQSGALASAHSSNITLTSLADLRETLAYDIGMVKIESLPKRVKRCAERYWAMDKYHRIDHGLRPPRWSGGLLGRATVYSSRADTVARPDARFSAGV